MALPSTTMTEADVLPIAREHAAETETLGHLHPAVFDALVAAGTLRRWVSSDVGGEDATVTEVLRSIEHTSRADGATGWCVMIANTTALTSHRLSAEWADTIFSDTAACTGGFGMPAGTARVVPGGLEVTGEWAWGSGTDHCTWIGGGVRIVNDDGAPAAAPDGATTPFVFFEPSQVELLDTWHVSGLKGTASTDYRVEKAFVPDGRWAQFVDAAPRVDAPLGHFPFFGALAGGVAAVLIGLAERAIDELVLLGEKRPSGSRKSLSERAPVQADLARAKANVAQSRSWLHETTDRVWADAASSGALTDQNKVDLRLAAAAAAERCLEAVDLCYHAGGGAAVYETSPLQRIFRDAHVAQSHGMIAPRMMEPLGRHAFGLPTDVTRF